jgi:tRNA(fMet)-specific endonuclease VapC
MVVATFAGASKIYVPVIVIAELQCGFLRGNRREKNEERLRQFLSASVVEVLVPSVATAHVYAELWNWLRARGTPIPENDIWIGALAVQNGLKLYTRDAHFDALPQVQRL